VAAQGGTTPARPDDAKLHPATWRNGFGARRRFDQFGVHGDGGTNDKVFLCGHPFLSLGDVQMPMARSRVVTTLSSDLASTKIVNVGGSIGTITGDHLTAVTGKLGAAPAMIPMELNVKTPAGEKNLHFELVNHPKLTPLLVGITAFAGLTQNAVYGEGTTLRMNGEIKLKGHPTVQLENTFAPGDTLNPDGLQIALGLMSSFMRIFANTFETPVVEKISLRVESVPGVASLTRSDTRG